MLVMTGSLLAQQSLNFVPQNVVQLSASGGIEAEQDLLALVLSTTRDGLDAAVLQSQLKLAVDAALVEVKKRVQPGQLEVRTGQFSLYPRYGRDGKPSGWQGSAELILEGRDFARISGVASNIQTLTVGSVSLGLSREQRARVEGDAQDLPIDRFKTNATAISHCFGFTGYTLRKINVSANDKGPS